MAAAALFSAEDLPVQLRAETPSVELFRKALDQQLLWIALDEKSDKALCLLDYKLKDYYVSI